MAWNSTILRVIAHSYNAFYCTAWGTTIRLLKGFNWKSLYPTVKMSVKIKSLFSKFQSPQINYFSRKTKLGGLNFHRKTQNIWGFSVSWERIKIFKLNQALFARSFLLLDFQLPVHPDNMSEYFQNLLFSAFKALTLWVWCRHRPLRLLQNFIVQATDWGFTRLHDATPNIHLHCWAQFLVVVGPCSCL